MFLLDKIEHALVTVYGDNPARDIAAMIARHIPDKDLRILTPGSPETLEQAARNSALTFIGFQSAKDPNLHLVLPLRETRMVACDIVAYALGDFEFEPMAIMGLGFDNCLTAADSRMPGFQKFLLHKIATGSRRLSGLILEEEYRRVCDALSSAPASMMIFDADKRTVFISDHYFRAYPKIASRLVRGLSVYDVFDMMAREEGLGPEDEVYEKTQRFWYNLEGSVEFQLKGVFYRVKAVQLPNRRGTVVMAQNISGYESARNALEKHAEKLQAELERISAELGLKNAEDKS